MIRKLFYYTKTKLKKAKRVAGLSRLIFNDYQTFKKQGTTPNSSVYAMRELFMLTNSKSNDVFSWLVRKPLYQFRSYPGIFQYLSKTETNNFIASMNSDGYYIFKQTLTPDFVEAMYQYAVRTPAKILATNPMGDIIYPDEKQVVDLNYPVSPRYQFDNNDILSYPEVQALIFDESIINLAQLYLKTLPYFDVLAFWWSLPFNGVGRSEAAQMFHFDLDKMKFIKFFFYLTDVDTDTGPHCYVKNTHKGVPKEILKDGRQEDEEIERVVGKERMIEISGKKGTIMAVDTRGLHKGKELIKGNRLLFQTMYASSLFGANYPDFDISKIRKSGQDVIAKYIEVFKKFRRK